jgi:hypothetical protein
MDARTIGCPDRKAMNSPLAADHAVDYNDGQSAQGAIRHEGLNEWRQR